MVTGMEHPQYPHVDQNPSLISLFASFLRLGATAFDGPAMVAYIRKMAADQKHWLDEKILRVVLIGRGISLIVL